MTPAVGDAIRTTCPYCGVGCGVIATRAADGTVTVAGDPDHPANAGRLCSKGSALAETLSLDGRLLHPLVQGQRTTWDAALDLVARRFGQTIAEHGPDSVAFYVSGQLLTEDYYVANKLMKGFIGSANIDTNSRLCMASSVAGHRRAFGADTVPGCYEDLELADLVVLVGSNLAWCHPILFQRLAAAKAERGTRVVVIDPRVTATCDIADLHLALSPGTDVALFNGLLAHLAASDTIDHRYVDRHTAGYAAACDTAQSTPLPAIARITGLAEADIRRFYDLFATTPKVVTVYSQGVNQSTAGTDKVNAIINCHLATGRIGRPGMGPFSVTGQPNAMGGREVGGLANMLAAHMDIENAAHRNIAQAFWQSPRIADKPGLKAVDMFRAVADGRIKALWIMATNPVDSLPDAESVRDALRLCPFVVVSDVECHTDTTALAHVLLPSLAWGEKDGTVTNSERRISRQRAFLPAPGEARADWWQFAELARRLGYGASFDYATPAEIFTEHARLSATENNGARDFDIGAFADTSPADYQALKPFQWPQARPHPEEPAKPASRRMGYSLGPSFQLSPQSSCGSSPFETAATRPPQGEDIARFFADGGFYTADRLGRFVATPYREPATVPSATFPLILNTGRIRDQWHTMTRTAKTARLMRHLAEPFVEVHPTDAARLGLASAHLAEIRSAHGTALARVLITARQMPGRIFAPIHWTDQIASHARIGALVGAHVDPVSGQPELKQTPVHLSPYPAAWYGFAVSRQRPPLQEAGYWAMARAKGGWRLELAGREPPADWSAFARGFLTSADTDGTTDILAYLDRATGQHRFAAFDADRLVGALFVAPTPVTAARDFLADQLEGTFDGASARFRLLAGRAPGDRPDPGPIVCACFEIGRNQILDAIHAKGCSSVEAVGTTTRAGTNCGSCRAEIGGLVHAARVAQAG